MKYTIGLDIGTSSVGWAVIKLNEEDNSLIKIEDLGVRLFESAENQKDGSSLASPRRIARGMRRRLTRRGYRLDAIKKIFLKNNILTQTEIEHLLIEARDPYEIRTRGLDFLLSKGELFLAIYHLAKRRGYKSNRKKIDESGGNGDEGKIVLQSASQNKQRMADKGYRTVGEMLYNDSEFLIKRNKGGNYSHCVLRETIINELNLILESQIKFGAVFLNETIARGLKKALEFQRPFAQGDQIRKLVGKCSFLKEEIRAAKASYSFQYFNLLQHINHITIKETENGDIRVLSENERQIIIKYVFDVKEANYHIVRGRLSLPESAQFNMVSYSIKRSEAEGKTKKELNELVEKKKKIPGFKDFYDIRKALEKGQADYWTKNENNITLFDKIGEVLTLSKTDEDITKGLLEADIKMPKEVINSLLNLSFSKFGHLSIKAIIKIIPGLEKGLDYEKACKEAGFSEFVNEKKNKLPPLNPEDNTMTNPVVKRATSQTIKVVNAIIDKYGQPSEVHIELARELAKDFKDRKKTEKIQILGRDINEISKKRIEELYNIREPNGQQILKYRLWMEQGNKCLYSFDVIDERHLLDDGYAEIDHIIPFSRSFDDSFANKVLVLKKFNQDKVNRTPFEYFGGDKDKWDRFENIINSLNLSYKKQKNLLTKKYVGDDLTTRTLNDTRYATRFIKNYIENNLEFGDNGKKQHVFTINGQATAYLRKRWGLRKDREESSLHHAQDAVVVAVTSVGIMQKVQHYSKMGEVSEYLSAHKEINKEVIAVEKGEDVDSIISEAKHFLIERHEARTKHLFPAPWDGFRDEISARMSEDPAEMLKLRKDNILSYKYISDFSDIKPIFVSRMPRRSIKGRLHQETLRSPKKLDKEISSVRVPLTSLTLKKLEEMVGKDSDKALYEILKSRLEYHGDDAKKAFEEPVYKPRKDLTQGLPVRSIKLESGGQKSGILVNKGKAVVDADSMVRIDIFSKENTKGKKQYFIIPIYANDFSKKELPDKVIVIHESESRWDKIDENYKFELSIYYNDLIKVSKGGVEKIFYYIGCNRANASISGISNDGSKNHEGLGIKTLDNIEKYVVDILGNYHKVYGEKRQLL